MAQGGDGEEGPAADAGAAQGEQPKNEEAAADFDQAAWEPTSQRFGIMGMLHLREAMMPIEKPQEVAHLKFLICPSVPGGEDEAEESRDNRGERPDRKGKGKGKEKGGKGRFVQDMGKTEVMLGSHKGTWWRNCGEGRLDVIVREQFALTSTELWKVPPGHYVQQGGPCEVFVNGQACGLQRMPVLPRGWATVDATAVGGPKYLEQVRRPTWRVIFSSGSERGDIVVRHGLSLDTPEVAVLLCGATVEQVAPQEVLEDGIVRMPISFGDGRGGKAGNGWVTCDATAQGGPKFFEPCASEDTAASGPEGAGPAAAGGGGSPRAAREQGGGREWNSWDKNRTWKVTNIGGDPQRSLAMVDRPEPFAPGTGKVPPEDMVVRWLNDGDILEQVGHSKKMRGFMVMPVTLQPAEGSGATALTGWVTRRMVDRGRDGQEDIWFVELKNGAEADRNDRRRPRRRRDGDD